MSTPSPEALAAAKELHAENWSAMTYDQMVVSGAAIIDRHFAALREQSKIDSLIIGKMQAKAIEFPEPGSKPWIDREVERSIEKGD